MKAFNVLLCVGFACFCSSTTTFGQPVISEFMASNSRTLADEDGAFADWIEIYNPGPGPVDLGGWFLTDTTNNLTRWRFPATNLNAGAYLVVFASNKDRRQPGASLHTNFRLDSQGEYLALVAPDGTNVVSAFDPRYPPQVPDVAFGPGAQIIPTTLIATDAPVRVLVPADEALGLDWTGLEFDDAAWTAGTNGVGYDTGLPDAQEDSYAGQMASLLPLGYWRFEETGGPTAVNLGTLGAGVDATYRGSVTLGETGPRPPDFGGFPANNRAAGFNAVSSRVQIPDAPQFDFGNGAFSLALWFSPSNAAVRGDLLTYKGAGGDFGIHVASQGANTISAYHTGFIGTGGSLVNGQWYFFVLTRDAAGQSIGYLNGAVIFTGTDSLTMNIASDLLVGSNHGTTVDNPTLLFNGRIDEVALWGRELSAEEVQRLMTGSQSPSGPVYASLLANGTDVQSAMYGVNSSIYVRIPFVVADPSRLERLLLHLQYDDGFVAYLNGQEVAAANAPEIRAWDMAATDRHPDFLALQPEEFDITAGRGFLIPGTNVLALQGLNVAATNTDFLVAADLTGTAIGASSAEPMYLLAPSPGAVNGVGTTNLGPVILNATHQPTVPNVGDALTVTAQVLPTFAPFAGMTLVYRVMYGPTNHLAMRDDGQGGDLTFGDGVFTAVISNATTQAGTMVRYYLQATDQAGRASRWPLFPDRLDSEEYQGTIVADPAIASHLPVMHLFFENRAALNTRTGTRCSVYYLDEFYDNVLAHKRGQSSFNWNKPGYNIDFNRDHRFKYRIGQPREKDVKVVSNWGDKANVRNALAYEMLARAGSAAHWAFQIRLQTNAAFYGLMDLMEDSDDRWLERLGYNPNDALYKMYNRGGSVGGGEKKTRLWEDKSDLQAVINSLNANLPLSSRVTYAYDHLDLPQFISYFAGSALISHQDHGHKNYYLFRDTEGTGEWALWPWDVDLSWGRTWTDGAIPPSTFGGYFQDVLRQDNILNFWNLVQQGSKGTDTNRFYRIIMDHPDFRQMYLRRLRTVMDTILQAPDTPAHELIIEARIREMVDQLDPPDVEPSDADLEFAAWPTDQGQWNNRMPYTTREDAQRIIEEHLPGRREWLFHSTEPNVWGDRIPDSQPADTVVVVGEVEANPASGNQREEYLQLVNTNDYAVDLSDWEVRGAVRHTFRPGTVLPAGASIYLSPDVNAFRARATGPGSGQNIFVQGNYDGNLSARGETVEVVNQSGRRVSAHTYPGAPSAAQQFLRVTEIMYNPAPLPGSPTDSQDFEYLELKNISATETLDLTGVHFTNGLEFSFTGSAVTNLGPGATVLVVRSRDGFAERYGAGFNIAGSYHGAYGGALDNGGERLRLLDAVGEEILDFTYNDRWYPVTDGLGFALVVVDEQADPDQWSRRTQWRASSAAGGSPDQENPPSAIPPIVISEILTHTEQPPPTDSIELHNPTAAPADIGGWFLTDDLYGPFKYRIPDGTIIPAGGYVVFDESDFNANPANPLSFALSSDGDEVYLYSGDAHTNLTGYLFGYGFGPAADMVSWGPHVTSQGEVHLVPQAALTLGTNNAGPRVGPVVIRRIMYHPIDLAGGADNTRDEFIELYNVSSNAVPLYDPGHATNTWRLRGGVDFEFPTNVVIGPSNAVLVLNFDPADTLRLAAFHARFLTLGDRTVFGPYRGKLSNTSDRVALNKPGMPDLNGVPRILVEEVEYAAAEPWPDANGNGAALRRVDVRAYANDPANWEAVAPFTLLSAPEPVTTWPGSNITFHAEVVGAGALAYQWFHDGGLVPDGTNATLLVNQVQVPDRGNYTVSVTDAEGASVDLGPVELKVLVKPTIVQRPVSQTVVAGQSVTLTVVVGDSATLPITYRWRLWGRDFTNMVLNSHTGVLHIATVVSNLHAGRWDVAIENEAGRAAGFPPFAMLTVRQPPLIIEQPADQIVNPGATAAFAVSATGNGPLSYQWWHQQTNLLAGETGSALNVANAQTGINDGLYSVVITNAYGVLTSRLARLTVRQTPAITQMPEPQTADACASNVAFTVTVEGGGPYGYQWYFNATNALPDATNDTLVIAPVRPEHAGDYSVVITNALGTVTSVVARLTFEFGDCDNDGMSDAYELAHGLDPASAADRDLDPDNDGRTNWQEAQSGTDPHDAQSVLRVSLTDGGAGGALIEFTAMPGISYRIEFTAQLGSGSWNVLTNISPSLEMTVLQLADPDAGRDGSRFYRAVIP